MTEITGLKGCLTVVVAKVDLDIQEAFSHFCIDVNGKQVPLNVIGLLTDTEHKYLVLHDMEGLVSEADYAIVEVVQAESMALTEINDNQVYQSLCDLWEMHLAQLEV